MIEADRMPFAQLMAQLDVLFSKESSKVKAQLYWEGLADIPIDVVRRGAERVKMTLDRYPSIAKWRQCCELVAREDDAKRAAELRGRMLDAMISRGAAVNENTGEIAEPVYNCQVCEDRGWAYFDYYSKAPLMFADTIGRKDPYFVRHCTCGHFKNVATRPQYAQIREEGAWQHG